MRQPLSPTRPAPKETREKQSGGSGAGTLRTQCYSTVYLSQVEAQLLGVRY